MNISPSVVRFWDLEIWRYGSNMFLYKESLKRIPLPFSVDQIPETQSLVSCVLGFYQVSKLLIATAAHLDLLWYLPVLAPKLTAPKKW